MAKPVTIATSKGLCVGVEAQDDCRLDMFMPSSSSPMLLQSNFGLRNQFVDSSLEEFASLLLCHAYVDDSTVKESSATPTCASLLPFIANANGYDSTIEDHATIEVADLYSFFMTVSSSDSRVESFDLHILSFDSTP